MSNWFVESQRSMLYRQMPIIPINVDPAFSNKKEFMSTVARLEQLTEMATHKEEYRMLIGQLKGAFLGGYEKDDRVLAPENRPNYK